MNRFHQQLPAGVGTGNTPITGALLEFDPLAQMQFQQSLAIIETQNMWARARIQADQMNEAAQEADWTLKIRDQRNRPPLPSKA